LTACILRSTTSKTGRGALELWRKQLCTDVHFISDGHLEYIEVYKKMKFIIISANLQKKNNNIKSTSLTI
jgi:hypothetical protein